MSKTSLLAAALSILVLAPAGGCAVEGEEEVGLDEVYTAPSGFFPTILARGNSGANTEVETEWRGLEDEIDGDLDFVYVDLTLAPGGHTGWHHHVGPVFGAIQSGAITTYHDDHPCEGETFSAGQEFIERAGVVEIARNETNANARVVIMFVVPKGSPFRIDSPAPPGACF